VKGRVTSELDADAAAGVEQWYRLSGVQRDGHSFTFGPISAVAQGAITAFALSPLSPNPSTGRLLVTFATPARTWVRLTLADVQGREHEQCVLDAVVRQDHERPTVRNPAIVQRLPEPPDGVVRLCVREARDRVVRGPPREQMAMWRGRGPVHQAIRRAPRVRFELLARPQEQRSVLPPFESCCQRAEPNRAVAPGGWLICRVSGV
jgi:hypothetical protein